MVFSNDVIVMSQVMGQMSKNFLLYSGMPYVVL